VNDCEIPSSVATGPRSVFSPFYPAICSRRPLRLFYSAISAASSVFFTVGSDEKQREIG